MTGRNPSDGSKGIAVRLERRRQLRGSLLRAGGSRAELRTAFTPEWWRPW